MLKVFPVPIYQDNYVWVIHNHQHCWVIDPGDFKPVHKACKQIDLTVVGVLITHRHWDHITGAKQLAETWSVPVYGPGDVAIQQVTHPLTDGCELNIFNDKVKVMAVPGHTREHIGYYFPDRGWLFSGDTVFSAGCGKILGGSIETLFSSIQRIKSLPQATVIYASHEYTLANLAFAHTVEPDNHHINDYRIHCQRLRAAGKPTLPTTLAKELTVNPFLRTGSSEIRDQVQAHFGVSCYSEGDVFKRLREWKDQF